MTTKTSGALSINCTNSITTSSCKDSFNDTYTCNTCGNAATVANTNTCCKSGSNCTVSGSANVGTCCSALQSKCSSCSPNQYGTAFSINPLANNGEACFRGPVGCPKNYVWASSPGRTSSETCYFCVDPNCDTAAYNDCTNCVKCKTGFSLVADGTCQPLPSLNMYLYLKTFTLSVTPCVTTFVDLPTDQFQPFSNLRLYPILAASANNGKLPFTGDTASVSARSCAVNGTILYNNASAAAAGPGYLSGFVDYKLNLGNSTVVFYINASNGLSQTCSVGLRVKDYEAPRLYCPNVYLSTNLGVNYSTWTWPRNFSMSPLGAVDNVGVVRSTCTGGPANNNFFFRGAINTVITCTAWDAANNAAACAFTVFVQDWEAPTINCPANITAVTSPGLNRALLPQQYATPMNATDNVGVYNFTCNPPFTNLGIFPIGSTRINCTVRDISLNAATCITNVVVRDVEKPVLNCTNQTLSASPTSSSVFSTFWMGANDNSGGDVNMTCLPGGFPSAYTFPLGRTTLYCQGSDAALNWNTCNVTITVKDTTAPILSCINSYINTLPGQNYSTLPSGYIVSATDNVNVTNISCTPSSANGTYKYSVGQTKVSCRASDAAGNVGVSNLTVIVADNQAPLVTCPNSISVGSFYYISVTVNFTAAQSWDNVGVVNQTLSVAISGQDTVYISPSSTNYTMPRGTATLTYTARDAAGLFAVCFWSISIYKQDLPLDTIPPNITNCPSPLVFKNSHPSSSYSDYSGNSSFTLLNTTALPSKPYAYVNWTAITSSDDSGFAFGNYLEWGPNLVTASTTGLTVGKYIVAYEALDVQGNSADCVFLINVWDVEPPKFVNCPSNQTYYTGAAAASYPTSWPVPNGPLATDNFNIPEPFGTCTSSVAGACPPAGQMPANPFGPGFYQFNFDAVDSSGNKAVPCQFNVTVIDNYPPTIQGCSSTTIQGQTAPGQAFGYITQLCPNLIVTDNVPLPVTTAYTSSPPGYNCSTPIPITTTNSIAVFFTATDSAGLQSVCSMYFTMMDYEVPTFTGCDPNQVFNEIYADCAPGTNQAVVYYNNITARDNSGGGVSIVQRSLPANLSSGSYFKFGQSIITYTAEDPSYNRVTCSIRITVRDTEPPVLVGFPSNTSFFAYTIVTDPGMPTGSQLLPNITSKDNVAILIQGYQPPNYNAGVFAFPVGATEITYASTDTSLNTVLATLSITVIDNQDPKFVGCPTNPDNSTFSYIYNTTLRKPTAIVSWTPITATDNVDGTHVPISIESDPTGFTSGSLFRVGQTTITYGAQDSSGNSISCQFIVEVQDHEPPSLLCPDSFVISTFEELTSITWRDPAVSDNNIVSSFYKTPNSPSPGNFTPGLYNVSFVAIDASNNVASCTFYFEINVPIPPTTSQSTQLISSSMAGYIGAAGAGLLLLVFLLFILLLVRQKKKSKKKIIAATAGYSELLAMSDEFILERARAIQQTLIEQRQSTPPMAVQQMIIHPERQFAPPPNTLPELMAYMRDICGKEIDRSDLEFGNELGMGEFGAVYEGFYNRKQPITERQKVAIKLLKEGDSSKAEENKITFLKEAAIMAQFNHPNIVSLVGVCTLPESEPTLIVLEYMHLGALLGYLQSPIVKGELTNLTMIRMALDVGAGMQYLSESGFVHRDLAARNVLVDKTMTCRIADFGLSVDLATQAKEKEEGLYSGSADNKLPIRWTAIEAICFKQFSTASDVWSFGVLMWEIWTYGEMPYKGWPNKKVSEQVANGYRLYKPPLCMDGLYEIMLKCWHKNPKRRPTFAKINQMLVDQWNEHTQDAVEGGRPSEMSEDGGDTIYDNTMRGRSGGYEHTDNGHDIYNEDDENYPIPDYSTLKAPTTDGYQPVYKSGYTSEGIREEKDDYGSDAGAKSAYQTVNKGDYGSEGGARSAYQMVSKPGYGTAGSTASDHYKALEAGLMAHAVATTAAAAAAAAEAADTPFLQGKQGRDYRQGPQRVNIGPQHVGKRVTVAGKGKGVLRFYGPRAGSGQLVCGVELDSANGNCNGTSNGKKYFHCKQNHGIIVPSVEVTLDGVVQGTMVNPVYDDDAVTPATAMAARPSGELFDVMDPNEFANVLNSLMDGIEPPKTGYLQIEPEFNAPAAPLPEVEEKEVIDVPKFLSNHKMF